MTRRVMALTFVVMGGALAMQQSAGQPTIPPPRAAPADTLVGAYYFPGWCQEERWYCIKANQETLHPLLGYYREGDPAAADWHIKWALEHGVFFFAFDYYLHGGGEMLEAALADGFLRSQFIDQFRFCLTWCNHAPAETQTLEELQAFQDLVIGKYLSHPSYLRIDGKVVVMILAGYSFVKTLGVEGARAAFEAFDQRCREAGLGGLYLAFCEGGIIDEQAVKDSLAAGCDAFCLYNYPYIGTEFTGPGQSYAEAPYADLIPQGEGLWKHWRNITGEAFWPTVMPGWDRRPWTKDRDLVRTGSTPELFGQALSRAKAHVNADNIVMIEAWNEWGEGSILEPSVEHGFAYLDQVREVFCPDAEPHKDVVPASLGRPLPAYDLELASVSAWAFDFGGQGWKGSRCEELTGESGVLVTTSTSGDPALDSTATYLPCEPFGSVRVRMRLTGPEGAPPTATGQFFWETVEKRMREELSVTFEVHVDGRWHEYEARLDANPNWTGTTDRVRIDPVDLPGVKIEIDRLELVPQ